MTDDMMSLRGLPEKTPDADLLCEIIGFVVGPLMELEVGAATGACYGEKSGERLSADGEFPGRSGPARASGGDAHAGHPRLRQARPD